MAHEGKEIVNPLTRQRIIYGKTAADTDGELFQMDFIMEPSAFIVGGEHIHPQQTETFEVRQGLLRFKIEGKERDVGVGEIVTVKPGTRHVWWNPSDTETARAFVEFRPALRYEKYFETSFGLARDGKTNQEGFPKPLQAAVLYYDFRESVRPPKPWQRALTTVFLPFAAAIGKLFGYRSVYPEYSDRDLHELQSDAYKAAPADEKRKQLWTAVARQPYSRLPPPKFSMVASFFRLLRLSLLRRAFSHVQNEDVRPSRTKAFHPWGTVAKVRFEPGGEHDFTGVFRSGAVGLVRLSLALDDKKYAPSAAFKWLIDGRKSRNILLDQSLDPQTSRDFFERAPTNITLWPTIPPMRPIWWAIQWWLERIAPPLHQPLDHVAEVRSDGTLEQAPKAPYQIFCYAPGEVHSLPHSKEDFRNLLARIPAGTVLYRVFGTESKDGQQVYLGQVRTESEFVASEFGDRVLSLQHYLRQEGG